MLLIVTLIILVIVIILAILVVIIDNRKKNQNEKPGARETFIGDCFEWLIIPLFLLIPTNIFWYGIIKYVGHQAFFSFFHSTPSSSLTICLTTAGFTTMFYLQRVIIHGFAGSKNKITRRNFVSKRFSNLRNSKRQSLPGGI